MFAVQLSIRQVEMLIYTHVDYSRILPHYSGIILVARISSLFRKLCQHNVHKPTQRAKNSLGTRLVPGRMHDPGLPWTVLVIPDGDIRAGTGSPTFSRV